MASNPRVPAALQIVLTVRFLVKMVAIQITGLTVARAFVQMDSKGISVNGPSIVSP